MERENGAKGSGDGGGGGGGTIVGLLEKVMKMGEKVKNPSRSRGFFYEWAFFFRQVKGLCLVNGVQGLCLDQNFQSIVAHSNCPIVYM